MRSLESIMTGLADVASGMLDPAEREVSGDLAESGESGWRALRQVLSLVIRRRFLSLKSVGPWLARHACHSYGSASVAGREAHRRRKRDLPWMWINNSDWTIIQSAGFWQLVRESAPDILFSYVTLACYSWTSGLLIGWSARRTRWLSGLVLFAVVLAVGLLGVPRSFAHILVLQRARDFHGNAAVFVAVFYRWVLPGILEICLVILPAWSGMRQGSRIARFGRGVRGLMLAFSAAVLGVLVSQNLLWWQMRGLGDMAAPFSPSSIACTAGACSTDSIPLPIIRDRSTPPGRSGMNLPICHTATPTGCEDRRACFGKQQIPSQSLQTIHR